MKLIILITLLMASICSAENSREDYILQNPINTCSKTGKADDDYEGRRFVTTGG